MTKDRMKFKRANEIQKGECNSKGRMQFAPTVRANSIRPFYMEENDYAVQTNIELYLWTHLKCLYLHI